jgi:hypothetical protein
MPAARDPTISTICARADGTERAKHATTIAQNRTFFVTDDLERTGCGEAEV